MKNKEIEKLLEYLKDENWDYYPADLIPYKVLLMEERDLLLSYIEQLEKQAELGEHYKHLYSEVKKQKEDVVEYIKKNNFKYCDDELCYMIPNHFNNLLRMLGEIE